MNQSHFESNFFYVAMRVLQKISVSMSVVFIINDSYNFMITGSQYHLSFNPRRNQNKGHPPNRHPLKLKLNQDLNNPGTDSRERPLFEKEKQYTELSSQSSRAYDQQRLKRQESERSIAQRVKRLQDLVLPMVERERDQSDCQFGWQSKVERKLMRIESSLDNVRKQWQIEMQKKLMLLEEQFQSRYEAIKAQLK